MAKSKNRKSIPRKRQTKRTSKQQAGEPPAALLPVRPNIDVGEERNRPRLLAVLFCDFVSITKDDKPNLLGVFDNIFVDAVKKQTPGFWIFIRLAQVTSDFTTTIFGPDDRPVLQFHSAVEGTKSLKEGHPYQSQTIARLQLTVKNEGIYWFDVSYEGNSLGGVGLPIFYRKDGGQGVGTETYI